MNWLRLYHGCATDPRWIGVARRAGSGCTPGAVYQTYCALREFASASKERGSIRGFDAESLADAWQEPQDRIESIVAALKARRIIVDERFVDWSESQPGDRTAALRQARRRAKKAPEVTDSHAASRVTPLRHATRGEESVAILSDVALQHSATSIHSPPSLTREHTPEREASLKSRGRVLDWVKGLVSQGEGSDAHTR